MRYILFLIAILNIIYKFTLIKYYHNYFIVIWTFVSWNNMWSWISSDCWQEGKKKKKKKGKKNNSCTVHGILRNKTGRDRYSGYHDFSRGCKADTKPDCGSMPLKRLFKPYKRFGLCSPYIDLHRTHVCHFFTTALVGKSILSLPNTCLSFSAPHFPSLSLSLSLSPSLSHTLSLSLLNKSYKHNGSIICRKIAPVFFLWSHSHYLSLTSPL